MHKLAEPTWQRLLMEAPDMPPGTQGYSACLCQSVCYLQWYLPFQCPLLLLLLIRYPPGLGLVSSVISMTLQLLLPGLKPSLFPFTPLPPTDPLTLLLKNPPHWGKIKGRLQNTALMAFPTWPSTSLTVCKNVNTTHMCTNTSI